MKVYKFRLIIHKLLMKLESFACLNLMDMTLEFYNIFFVIKKCTYILFIARVKFILMLSILVIDSSDCHCRLFLYKTNEE